MDSVKQAVALVREDTDLRVHVNGTDLALLKKIDLQARKRWFDREYVKFVSDDAVERGGCVVKTAGGEIDAQLSTQVDRIARQLVPALAQRVKGWLDQQEVREADPADSQGQKG